MRSFFEEHFAPPYIQGGQNAPQKAPHLCVHPLIISTNHPRLVFGTLDRIFQATLLRGDHKSQIIMCSVCSTTDRLNPQSVKQSVNNERNDLWTPWHIVFFFFLFLSNAYFDQVILPFHVHLSLNSPRRDFVLVFLPL